MPSGRSGIPLLAAAVEAVATTSQFLAGQQPVEVGLEGKNNRCRADLLHKRTAAGGETCRNAGIAGGDSVVPGVQAWCVDTGCAVAESNRRAKIQAVDQELDCPAGRAGHRIGRTHGRGESDRLAVDRFRGVAGTYHSLRRHDAQLPLDRQGTSDGISTGVSNGSPIERQLVVSELGSQRRQSTQGVLRIVAEELAERRGQPSIAMSRDRSAALDTAR